MTFTKNNHKAYKGLGMLVFVCLATSCSLFKKDGEGDRASEAKESKEKILIDASEITRLQDEVRKAKAELESKTLEQNIVLKNEFHKGYEAGKKDSSSGLSDEVSKVMAEANKAVEESAQALAKFAYPAAVVNGTCVGRMAQGGLYKFSVVNACVNVVYKRVNSRAEVVGIEAASLEAQKEGVVSLTCDAGDAHFALIPKKCSDARSSGGGVQRIDGSRGR